MANWLSIGLLFTPAMVGVGLLSMTRRIRPISALYLTLATLMIALLCALGLTAYVEQALPLRLTWLPGAGAMTLHIGTTGLYAALFTIGSAILVCLAVLPTPSPPSMSGLLLIALSAANIAFLSGHFLGRYVALEIVGVCIAAAPLLALHNDAGTRLAKSVYLLLRVGDAGFLVAILILLTHIDTLDITPALENGLALDIPLLNWAVAGFILAVWVKVGAWPFHSWLRAGHKLPLDARVWLYATVMPNLGLYLLYRVTPLLATSQLQPWILAMSIGTALVSSVLAVLQRDEDTRLAHLNAAQGALALCTAAAGLKAVVWLFLPVMTLLQFLLALAHQTRQHAPTSAHRRWETAAALLAGCAMTSFNALLLWWLIQVGTIPTIGHYALDITVVLVGYCALRTSIKALLDAEHVDQPNQHVSKTFKDWTPETVVGILSTLTLLSILGISPLLRAASHITHNSLPSLPDIFTFISHWGTKVTFWLALVILVMGERFYQLSSRIPGHVDTSDQSSNRALLAFAQALQHWIEQNVLEGIITKLPRSILAGAKTLHQWVERGVLEWVVTGLPRGILSSAQTLHHLVEQQGLEGALHAIGRATLFASQQLQRLHTGRLRVNMTWVVGILVILVTTLVLRGW